MKKNWEKFIDTFLGIVALVVGFLVLKTAFTFMFEYGKVIFKNLF